MNLQNPAKWFMNWLFGDWSDSSGKNVSSEAALSYAPIWYGVNKISGHIAQLPISVYERVDGGGEKVRQHQITKLLRKPNAYQTGTIFREQVAAHSLLDGNGRAAIVRNGARVVELLPLPPECSATGMIRGVKVHATRPAYDDRLRMFFEDVNGETDSTGVIMLDDSEVVHIPGLSLDGISGLPLKKIAQRTLNTAINTEKRINKQFEQGFTGSLMLEAPAGMFRNEGEAQEFLSYFEERHNSPDKAGKPGLLREGMRANLLQSSNRDAEMTDSRLFQRQDAALLLGLEQILGDDSSVSYNSLEQKTLAYLMNCLNRWLRRWEEELEFKLLPSRQYERDTHYIRFNTAALLKSDYKQTIESLSAAIAATIISPNEARQKIDMLPYNGGDVHQNPAITPGADDDSGEMDEPDEAPAVDPSTAARLSHLFGVEARRVKQAAGKASNQNFVEWIDKFYASNWEPKLADWFEELGLDRDLARTHCEDSKGRLLEVLDYSSPDTLEDNVSKCVGSWKNRTVSIGECHV